MQIKTITSKILSYTVFVSVIIMAYFPLNHIKIYVHLSMTILTCEQNNGNAIYAA